MRPSVLTPSQIDRVLEREAAHACSGIGGRRVCVRIVAIADLPSRFGRFQIAAFRNNRDGQEHVVVMHGNVFGQEDVPTRVHSACLTGEGLGSLRCDCREQLEASLRFIATRPCGLVLYLQQEGRGIGLLNKIRAYGLQDRGLDTVDANRALGFRDDEREYSIAAHMLNSLRVRSIQLLTNNPRKLDELSRHGIHITRRIPHVMPPNEFNRLYLETKAARSGHLLDPVRPTRTVGPVEARRNTASRSGRLQRPGGDTPKTLVTLADRAPIAEATWAFGSFTLPRRPAGIVMLAGGIGVTPFRGY